MSISRRLFLTEASVAGVLAALPSAAQVAQHSTAQANAKPTIGESYWSNLYKTGESRGEEKIIFGDEMRDPRFAYADEKNGLRWVEDNKREDLPSFEDDAVVTLELGGFRVGKIDQPKLSGVRFAQMHLSCQQVKGTEFIGPLAWAALATVFSGKAKQLPSVQDLNFSQQSSQTMPGAPQLNHVLLTGGAGHLSVNVTTTPTTSMLDKILSITVKTTKAISPLFGFPAISIPALTAFSDFYGKLEKAAARNFLINTSLKDVAVTQRGGQDPNVSSKAVNLLSGYYILVPKSQEDLLANKMGDLALQNGYLIERNDLNSKLPVDDRVNNAIPELTYVTLHVDVKSASSYTSSSAAKTDDPHHSEDNGKDSKDNKNGDSEPTKGPKTKKPHKK